MVNSNVCAWLELCVIIFQVSGVAALCLNRLLPATRWADHGRVGLIIAMVGLGTTGACCGRLDSEFGLFAGGTMTVLLIGMIIGNGAIAPSVATHKLLAVKTGLAN